MQFAIHAASTRPDLDQFRHLLREYGDSLGDHLRHQNFEQELDTLPGSYTLPAGCILLATFDDQPIGCIALRPLANGTCELKRLYVRAGFRAAGVGRKLTVQLLGEARTRGYRLVRLDTMPWMDAAFSLYKSLGFAEIEPYTDNPIPGARFMELRL